MVSDSLLELQTKTYKKFQHLDRFISVSVLGDSEKAGLYDDTSGALIGSVYRGRSNAKRELKTFANRWLDDDPRDYVRKYGESILNYLFVAYKVERGFSDKDNWTVPIENAEEALERDIKQGSFN